MNTINATIKHINFFKLNCLSDADAEYENKRINKSDI